MLVVRIFRRKNEDNQPEQEMTPMVDFMKQSRPDVDYQIEWEDEKPELFKEMNIKYTPTIIYVVDGEPKEYSTGYQDFETIIKTIDRYKNSV